MNVTAAVVAGVTTLSVSGLGTVVTFEVSPEHSYVPRYFAQSEIRDITICSSVTEPTAVQCSLSDPSFDLSFTAGTTTILFQVG